MENLKPKKRSILRITLGKLYYRGLRYIYWYFSKIKFSKNIISELLQYTVFSHSTPLIRKLKDVDMWMQHNKVENLRIAIRCIDGVILAPGETFSYWRLIGNPKASKGYKEGMVLYCGGFKPGVGGGLCQLSNLIYWMTLHTQLRVTERYRHSYDVFPDAGRTQPFGSGATCVYNYRDLQIYNGTNTQYQLHVYISDGHLHGEWRSMEEENNSYEVYEKKHWITNEYWGGYIRNNIIHRKVFSNEKVEIADELICENHAIMMYQPFLTGDA